MLYNRRAILKQSGRDDAIQASETTTPETESKQ